MNVIQLEHVGKRYWLRHRPPDRRLMEVLHDGLASVGGLLTGRPRQRPAAGEEFWALQDVSLEIQPGEVVGLIGRNGAGKSTLLKLISWIMAPTTGRVGVRGRMGCLLEVGSGFHPELTGRENVFLNGAILGMSLREIHRKFDQIVYFAEVEAFLDTPVKHYSSGMFVRLAFAVAAMLEPEILIVDEVLSVGDASFQQKALGAMQEAVRRGTTCLMVSHHLPSVVQLCRRAVLLEHGRIVADGPPADVVRRYLAAARGADNRIAWTDLREAPGDETVRLVSVEVSSSRPAESAALAIDGEIRIRICSERLVPGPVLPTWLTLKDESGIVVLVSSSGPRGDAPAEGAAGDTQPTGTMCETCTIPPRLLNEGRYSASVSVGGGLNEAGVAAVDCVSFEVEGADAERGLIAGRWPGVIRPQLVWNRTADA